MKDYTGCGRNKAHILKVYKNQKKKGTQKIVLFIKSTYDASPLTALLGFPDKQRKRITSTTAIQADRYS